MKNYIDLLVLPMALNLFDGNTNVTTDAGLTDEMKVYYSTYLIRPSLCWFTTSLRRSTPFPRTAVRLSLSASMTACPRLSPP